MRSANPALNDEVFKIDVGMGTRTMTLEGTASKTLLLLGLLVITASLTWSYAQANIGATWGFVMGGALAGLVVALITLSKPTVSPYTSPIYAVCEGVLLGALSMVFESRYPGIVPQAILLTFGVMASLLLAYRLRLVQATANFRLGVVAATGGIMLVYIVGMGMRLFGFGGIPMIHEATPIGIGFSLFVVVIAALNLVLDFDFIETGVERGAPKYMEWYAAFGLLVTLVWLYIEILRLLAKLRDR